MNSPSMDNKFLHIYRHSHIKQPSSRSSSKVTSGEVTVTSPSHSNTDDVTVPSTHSNGGRAPRLHSDAAKSSNL